MHFSHIDPEALIIFGIFCAIFVFFAITAKKRNYPIVFKALSDMEYLRLQNDPIKIWDIIVEYITEYKKALKMFNVPYNEIKFVKIISRGPLNMSFIRHEWILIHDATMEQKFDKRILPIIASSNAVILKGIDRIVEISELYK